jgi:SAM-dependent methyltransferase
MKNVADHFSYQYDAYKKSVLNTNQQWYRNINEELELFLDGDVLDIGNGGFFTYDVKKARSITAVDVAFKDTMRLTQYSNVRYVCDDARSLSRIQPQAFDTVIFQLILHHLVDRTKQAMLHNILCALRAARRSLKVGGKLVIVEITILRPFEVLESVLYPLGAALFGLMNKPAVGLLSNETIINLMRKADIADIGCKSILYGTHVDIFNGIKPGFVVVPSWLAPQKCFFFQGTKRL